MHAATLTLAQVRARSRELQSHILGRTQCPSDKSFEGCIAPYVRELSALISNYTVWKLNDSGGDTTQVTKDLHSVEDIYERELWKKERPDLDEPDSGEVHAFRQKTPSGELVVTVNHFSSGGLALPAGVIVIQGFRREGDRFVYAGQTGDSLFGTASYDDLETLVSPRQNEMWLLVSGRLAVTNIGRLNRARIYSFDGNSFHELWSPEDREILRFHISGNEVHLTYLGAKIERSFGFPEQHVMEEKLLLSPSGLSRTILIDHGLGEPSPPK